MPETENRAAEQAKAQYENITAMVQRREAAKTEKQEDDSLEEIESSALSVRLRADWHAFGESSEDCEYEILLCTGGPAVRIIGDLGSGGVESAVLQWQDWMEPWTEYRGKYDEDVLMEYANRLLPI